MLNESMQSSDTGLPDANTPTSLISNSPRKAPAGGASSHSIKVLKKSRTKTFRSSVYPSSNSIDDPHGVKSRPFGELKSDDHPPESETSDRFVMNGVKIISQRIGRRQRTLKASGPSSQSNISTDIGSEAGAQGASVTSSPRSSPPPSAARTTVADMLDGNDSKSRTIVQASAEKWKKKLNRKATSSSNLSQKLKFIEDNIGDTGAGLGQKFRNSATDEISNSSSVAAQCHDLAKVDPSCLRAEPHRSAEVVAATTSGEYMASTMSSAQFEVDPSSLRTEPSAVAASTASSVSVGESKELSKNTQNSGNSTTGGLRLPATISKVKKAKKGSHFKSPTHKSRKSTKAKLLVCSSHSIGTSSRPVNVPMLPLSSIPREASSGSEEGVSKKKTYDEADSASSSESSTEDEDDDPAVRKIYSEQPLKSSTHGIPPDTSPMSPQFTGAQSLPTTGFCSSNSGTHTVGEMADKSLFDTPTPKNGSKRFDFDNDEEEREGQDAQDSESDDGEEEEYDDEEEESEEESGDEEVDKEKAEPDTIFPNDYRVEYKPFAFSRWTPAIVRHYDKGFYVLDVHPHVHHSRVRKIQDPLVNLAASMAHAPKDPRREMAKPTTTARTATSRSTRKSKASQFKSLITAPYHVMRRYWCLSKSKKPQEPSTEESSEGSTRKTGWFKRSKAKAEPRQGLLEMTT